MNTSNSSHDSVSASLRPSNFFEHKDSELAQLFERCEYPWQLLQRLPKLLADRLGGTQTIKGNLMEGAWLGRAPIYIEEDALIEPGAYIVGPAYIGTGAVVRHGAYIRENSILMAGSLVGHASEVKGSVLFPDAKAPHFAYVGDSILGSRVNLGAGTKLSNVPITNPSDRAATLIIEVNGERFDTGLRKFGAIVGDDTHIGCNAVLNPGVLLGPRMMVYANATVNRGLYKAGQIIKVRQHIEVAQRRP